MSILAHSLDLHRTRDVILNENVTFESLLLNKHVLRGLSKSGFKKPSPIQVKAIPIGRCGFDLIVKSKSGTGKTLVYALIALEIVEISKTDTQILVIVPTREIAVQIEEVLLCIGKYIDGLQVRCFIGGLPLEADKEKCQICHIAIGTPGRVKHLITDGILKTDLIRLFVLDEVDKLMEYSFLNDVNEIYNSLSGRTQIITTSATYNDELNSFLHKYMLSPTSLAVEDDTPFLWGVKQFVHIVKHDSNVVRQMKVKIEEILKIFSNISFTQCIIFTNYKVRAENISNILNQKGWTSIYLSAAKTQPERLTAINNVKKMYYKILLSTDLTARGIDVANIDLIINYDVPVNTTTYLHRMGRAGRYGSMGICINLVSEGAELQKIQNIIDTIGGSSLSIPELSNLNDSLMDSVNVPSKNNFSETPQEILHNSDLHLKKGISDLQERNTFQTQNRKQKDRDQFNLATNSIEECDRIEHNITEFLNDIKKESELVVNELCNEDTNTVLKSLASGEFKMESDVNEHNTSLHTELQQIIVLNKCKPLNAFDDDKPKSIEFQPKLSNATSVQKTTANEILYKNKALLCLLTMISIKTYTTEHVTMEKNTLECIQTYLKILKERERKEIQDMLCSICQNEIEILKNIDQYNCYSESNNKQQTTNENLEKVFKIGHDSITKPTSRRWQTYFPNSVSLVQKVPSKEKIIDKIDDYCMNETNTSLDNYMINTEYAKYKSEDINWIPVENSEEHVHTLNTTLSSWEHFYNYFNNCSEQLWSNGLSFENVKNFDDWFYCNWQTYIFAVRNYIQQNIYLQEMKKYQELNKKY